MSNKSAGAIKRTVSAIVDLNNDCSRVLIKIPKSAIQAIVEVFWTDSLEGDVKGDGVVNVFDMVFVAGKIQWSRDPRPYDMCRGACGVRQGIEANNYRASQ